VSAVGKQKWSKETVKLPWNHAWKAKPGHKIIVLGRGDVRFDYPAHWVAIMPEAPGEISVKLHNKPPPDDDWRLEVSYLVLNPSYDFSGLTVATMLEEVGLKEDHRNPFWRSGVTEVKREDGLEYAWAEIAFTDPVEQRVAYSRICVARRRNIQPLITLDYWEEDAGTVIPAWEEVLRTLRLAEPLTQEGHARKQRVV
jgi:hypothetical protein